MKPKFSLQPVLDYRHSRVEALEIELGQLLATRQQGVETLEQLRQRKAGLFEEMHRQQEGELDLGAVGYLRSNIRLMEGRIVQQMSYLEEMDRQVRGKQAEIVQARQDEETLATLKKREIERYQAEETSRENRSLDDVYIARAFRQAASLRP